MVDINSCKGTLQGSKECDRIVQAFCNSNQNDLEFCGCSTNAFKQIPDPKLGQAPVKCWANTCNKNANAYQFFYTKDAQCPNVCIDNSTITALGSTITDSAFNQASCGAEVQASNPETEKTIKTWGQYGLGFAILIFVIVILMSSSISSLFIFK